MREAALQPFRNRDVSLPVGLLQAVVGQPQLAIFVQRTERRGPSGTEYVRDFKPQGRRPRGPTPPTAPSPGHIWQ